MSFINIERKAILKLTNSLGGQSQVVKARFLQVKLRGKVASDLFQMNQNVRYLEPDIETPI